MRTAKGALTVLRRELFRMAVAGGVMATLARPRAAPAQSTLTPDEALKALMDGNARFTAGQLTSFQEDLTLLAQKTAEKQEPFAAVLSCADSRVPVEILFDQTIGHVFVTRVAGNVTTPEIIASLEYGTAVLGARVVMVLGHGGCGAVTAAIAGKAAPGAARSALSTRPGTRPWIRRARIPRRRSARTPASRPAS
jgi:carbonic anhydrase